MSRNYLNRILPALFVGIIGTAIYAADSAPPISLANDGTSNPTELSPSHLHIHSFIVPKSAFSRPMAVRAIDPETSVKVMSAPFAKDLRVWRPAIIPALKEREELAKAPASNASKSRDRFQLMQPKAIKAVTIDSETPDKANEAINGKDLPVWRPSAIPSLKEGSGLMKVTRKATLMPLPSNVVSPLGKSMKIDATKPADSAKNEE